MKNHFEVLGSAVARIEVWYRGSRMDCWIDTADLPLVAQYDVLWSANPARSPQGKYYVLGKRKNRDTGRAETILIHRVILGLTDPSIEGDHRDNNGLNNRRANLRPCTHLENLRYRFPDRDWAEYDRRMGAAMNYALERKISAQIQRQFSISRQQMWNIRGSAVVLDSAGARAYHDALDAASVRSLAQMQADAPRDGKWGVGLRSRMLDMPQERQTRIATLGGKAGGA